MKASSVKTESINNNNKEIEIMNTIPEIERILANAKTSAKTNKGSISTYEYFKGQLRDLQLPYDVYEDAIYRLTKILRV